MIRSALASGFRRVANWFERRFEGARVDRTTTDWILSQIRTNDDIKANLETLVMRSRDLSKNNSDFRKWLRMRAKNIIGHNGIIPQFKVLNLPNSQGKVTQDTVANSILQREWRGWSRRRGGAVSIDGLHDWRSFQTLCDRTFAVDGECFVRILRGIDNPWAFSLQLIDATLVDITYNQAPTGPRENEVIMGVERNRWGVPVRYHVRQEWNNAPQARVAIPASEMIHIFSPEFVGQARGFPRACAAILDMNMSAGYREAELIAARIGACTMGIWQRQANATGKIKFDGKDEGDQKFTMNMEPGKFAVGPRGYEFKSHTPSHPGQQVGSFLKTINRSVANGLDVAYNDFANDLENVNFSSMRGGTLSERDGWKCDQQFFIEAFCEFVGYAWTEQLLLTGRTILPYSKIAKFDAIIWTPRRWDWVDPLRDIKADREGIDLKVLTPQAVIRETGDDPDEVLEQLAEWQEKLRVYGLLPAATENSNEPQE